MYPHIHCLCTAFGHGSVVRNSIDWYRPENVSIADAVHMCWVSCRSLIENHSRLIQYCRRLHRKKHLSMRSLRSLQPFANIMENTHKTIKTFINKCLRNQKHIHRHAHAVCFAILWPISRYGRITVVPCFFFLSSMVLLYCRGKNLKTQNMPWAGSNVFSGRYAKTYVRQGFNAGLRLHHRLLKYFYSSFNFVWLEDFLCMTLCPA